MKKYAKHVSKKSTIQTEQMNETQVQNNAGGYVWEVDCWKKLDRFLVLGNDGGSYYASEKEMTKENAQAVLECLNQDGKRAIERIVEMSESGRICKNDSAIFALALASSVENKEVRKLALQNLNKICRIGTHLFTFLENVKELKGKGRGLRNSIANWYISKEPFKLAYQVAKYRNRNNWTHLDALRISHPKTKDKSMISIFNWIKNNSVDEHTPELLKDFNDLQNAKTVKEVLNIIKKNKDITWEMIDTKFLKEKRIWKVLLPNLSLTAMIRNLGRMTANETLKPLSKEVDIVVSKLKDKELIKKSRIHPIQILSALNVYSLGKGIKGNLTWTPISQINASLNEAFYLAFDNIEKTGKKFLLAVDCSSSMTCGTIAGIEGMTPHVVSAAMAMVTARTEEKNYILGFSTDLVDLKISPSDSLEIVMKKRN